MQDTVSIVIPVLNEEFYIKKLLESILNQDYDFSKIEVIFVDGDSKDETVSIINNELADKQIDYTIITNKEKITPKSVNMGIKIAKNDIVIRLDAHSEYPKNYISKCVYYLNTTGADNVGCLSYARSEGIIGNTIAEVLSSKFGVGNSKFRTNSQSGYVDTVPFGTFRRSLFDKIGYFNEELIRSEDNEINYRIIKNGGKVYLFNDISSIYHPRNTIRKLLKMGYENGKWSTYTGYFIPGSMKLRHFIPFLFVLSLICGLIISILGIKILTMLFIGELALYLILDLVFSLKNIKRVGIISSLISIIIYPLFHISYGIGSVIGIGKIIKKKVRNKRCKTIVIINLKMENCESYN